jgi:hypothetical protein
MLAWFPPDLVGGGDGITQRTLAGAGTLALVPMAFLVRFALGAVAYAAGTPGGLFAPLLVLGAQTGLLFGAVFHMALPSLDIQPEGFAVVGLAAFFTGAVRTPLTGIVLVTEMTANVTMLLPMLGACFAAMLLPTCCAMLPSMIRCASTRSVAKGCSRRKRTRAVDRDQIPRARLHRNVQCRCASASPTAPNAHSMRQECGGTAPNWDILAARARASLPLSRDGGRKSAEPRSRKRLDHCAAGSNAMTFRNARWRARRPTARGVLFPPRSRNERGCLNRAGLLNPRKLPPMAGPAGGRLCEGLARLRKVK